jgi:hypothetical protein
MITPFRSAGSLFQPSLSLYNAQMQFREPRAALLSAQAQQRLISIILYTVVPSVLCGKDLAYLRMVLVFDVHDLQLS